ncbi:DUF4360 domain-containing protein [Actinomadura pelletieri]|uniref:DUF4360 domain-containing protein n=1 Tax=Actinomadura pelletieri TaxID=111805 RepID=UPI0014778340|nr:DUF4360 domain-containing protein [Actinomadura pelletieri]
MAASALAGTTVSAAPAAAGTGADRGPDPPLVTVEAVTGSGCAEGTVGASLPEDREALLLTYLDFTAQVGGSARPTDVKDCQVTLRASPRRGYSYAIVQTDQRGFAHLAPDAIGNAKINFGFENQRPSGEVTRDFRGPFKAHWQTTVDVPVDQLVFTPCDESPRLLINSRLWVDAYMTDWTKTSLIEMGSSDGFVMSTYHLVWKRCA